MVNAVHLTPTLSTVKVIDEKRLKEEDVRKTLSKMDINKYVDVDEIKKKAEKVAEQSKDTLKDIQEQSTKVVMYAKDSMKDFNVFKVLRKADVEAPKQGNRANVPPSDVIHKDNSDMSSNDIKISKQNAMHSDCANTPEPDMIDDQDNITPDNMSKGSG